MAQLNDKSQAHKNSQHPSPPKLNQLLWELSSSVQGLQNNWMLRCIPKADCRQITVILQFCKGQLGILNKKHLRLSRVYSNLKDNRWGRLTLCSCRPQHHCYCLYRKSIGLWFNPNSYLS
jgi:hypothetical protein